MSQNIIELFVMHSCQVCPQMEKIFHQLHQNGAIDELKIIDIGENPEIAQQLNIRSVPYYLINGFAFHGLKTQNELLKLFKHGQVGKWQEFIKSELSEGQLNEAEKAVIDNPTAREAMMLLLQDIETSLVVRIGLSAIIESVVETGLLNDYESQFIALSSHQDERIAIDAIYYLSLLASRESLLKLKDIAQNGEGNLKQHADEILHELQQEKMLN
ncbi:MAG: hypothetical protein GY744_07555 [Gammaproteobacteria bacterium]|nr:hypothetical protein [Gammaproteobacteria bacterium]